MLRDRLIGLLYGVPIGLAATAGLFHILIYHGVTQSEMVMGVYQLSVAVLFAAAFVYHSWSGE